jgi:N-acetylglucosaminyldiphosphoundecaprenol N-acetyl-beta-D-mannosaminyltransferase
MNIRWKAERDHANATYWDYHRAVLWGVPLHAVSSKASLDAILGNAKTRTSFAVEYVAVNNLVTGALNPDFRETLFRFDLCLADGKPVHWILKYLLRRRESAHTTAREQMLEVCGAAVRHGLSICLYGTTAETLKRLEIELVRHFPNLVITMRKPSVFRPLTSAELDDLIAEFNRSRAHILFVALGCPLQEQFVAAIRDRVASVCLCVGSAFEIHAGTKRAPPAWLKNMGMEWLFRLLQDPRRLWKRYAATNIVFLYLLAQSAARRLFRGTWD